MEKTKKFVKKAKQWCVTIVQDDQQTQEWFDSEEKADEFIKGENEN